MDIDDILLLITDASEDGIHGKTAMQKIGYIVSVTLQKNMGWTVWRKYVLSDECSPARALVILLGFWDTRMR